MKKKLWIFVCAIMFVNNVFSLECLNSTEIPVKSISILSTNAPSRFIITDGNYKGFQLVSKLYINRQDRLSNDVDIYKTNDNSTQNVFLMSPYGYHTEFSARLIDPSDNKLGLHVPFYQGESAIFYTYGNVCFNWSSTPIDF